MSKQAKKQEGRAPTFNGEGFSVKPGTTIKRAYKGKEIAVQVRADGFHFGGKVYTSLSAVATKITDVQTNGLKWFGFRKGEAKPKAKSKKSHTPKAHRKAKKAKKQGDKMRAAIHADAQEALAS